MRRVLQLLGLSGLLVTGFATDAFAQETPNADEAQPPHHGRSRKPAQPAAGRARPPPQSSLQPSMPKVGDITANGYFRGGFGAQWPEGPSSLLPARAYRRACSPSTGSATSVRSGPSWI